MLKKRNIFKFKRPYVFVPMCIDIFHHGHINLLVKSKKLGNVNSTRAVGNANGSNPISILIPCHRVIGSNGKLVGYASGLSRKSWLLAHEARIVGS